MTFRTTDNFLKMFGLRSLKELPKLPKYKFDSNRQIVIEDLEDDSVDYEEEKNNEINNENP